MLIELEGSPPLRDLPAAVLAAIINWPEAAGCRSLYMPIVLK
jgi:hypothetical protein